MKAGSFNKEDHVKISPDTNGKFYKFLLTILDTMYTKDCMTEIEM